MNKAGHPKTRLTLRNPPHLRLAHTYQRSNSTTMYFSHVDSFQPLLQDSIPLATLANPLSQEVECRPHPSETNLKMSLGVHVCVHGHVGARRQGTLLRGAGRLRRPSASQDAVFRLRSAGYVSLAFCQAVDQGTGALHKRWRV